MFDFSKMSTAAERKAERAARPLRVVFTGSRDWMFLPPVQGTVRRLVDAGMRRCAHGAARGLDALVDAEARLHEGLHIEPYRVSKAAWAQSKAAGIHRNLDMLMGEEPHLVVAFPDAKSIGTWHCAVAADCPVLVCLLGSGVRQAIEAHARICEIDITKDRARAVEAWVSEPVRETIMKSRGMLSWPEISMPDPTKAWVLLRRSVPKEIDPRAQAGIDALLR